VSLSIRRQRSTWAVIGAASCVLAASAGQAALAAEDRPLGANVAVLATAFDAQPAAAASSVAPSLASAPKDFNRYVGGYEVTRYAAMIVTRQGDGLLLTQQQGPPPELFLPDSGGVWTGTQSGRKFTFDLGPDGQVLALSFSQKPFPGTMKRLPNGEAETRAVELATKLKAQVPDGRTEGAIRELVRSVLDGNIDFDRLFGDREAMAARAQLSDMQGDFKSLGGLKTLTFNGVGGQGGDIYEAAFANGNREFRILLDKQGRIDAMGINLK
jgi:Domain of unknown function (DUF3471)